MNASELDRLDVITAANWKYKATTGGPEALLPEPGRMLEEYKPIYLSSRTYSQGTGMKDNFLKFIDIDKSTDAADKQALDELIANAHDADCAYVIGLDRHFSSMQWEKSIVVFVNYTGQGLILRNRPKGDGG